MIFYRQHVGSVGNGNGECGRRAEQTAYFVPKCILLHNRAIVHVSLSKLLLILFWQALLSGCHIETVSVAERDAQVDAAQDACCVCPDVSTPQIKSNDGTMAIIAAGAPLEMFGAEDAPDFVGAFQTLTQAGFTGFFPLFESREIDGNATISPLFDYWWPASLSETARNCSLVNPYEAAHAASLGVVFPAFLLTDVSDDDFFDENAFWAHYHAFESECAPGFESAVSGFESFDEIACRNTANDFQGIAGPNLGNVVRLADALRPLDKGPIYLVECPLPWSLEQETSLSEAQKNQLTTRFWGAVEEILPGADIFGFDLYPVPDSSLSLVRDSVAEAVRRSPDKEHVAVLQAFSPSSQSGGSLQGRGPTEAETRFMAFDALVAGARHLVWYGASTLNPSTVSDDAAIWQGVLNTAHLISQIAGSLDGSRVDVTVPDGVAVMARSIPGGVLVVLINRNSRAMDVEVTLPFIISRGWNYEHPDEKVVSQPGVKMETRMGSQQVSVLVGAFCQ